MRRRDEVYQALEGEMTASDVAEACGLRYVTNARKCLAYLERWGQVERCGTTLRNGVQVTLWRRT